MVFFPEIFTSEPNLCLRVYDGNLGDILTWKLAMTPRIKYYEFFFYKILHQRHALYTFSESGSYMEANLLYMWVKLFHLWDFHLCIFWLMLWQLWATWRWWFWTINLKYDKITYFNYNFGHLSPAFQSETFFCFKSSKLFLYPKYPTFSFFYMVAIFPSFYEWKENKVSAFFLFLFCFDVLRIYTLEYERLSLTNLDIKIFRYMSDYSNTDWWSFFLYLSFIVVIVNQEFQMTT